MNSLHWIRASLGTGPIVSWELRSDEHARSERLVVWCLACRTRSPQISGTQRQALVRNWRAEHQLATHEAAPAPLLTTSTQLIAGRRWDDELVFDARWQPGLRIGQVVAELSASDQARAVSGALLGFVRAGAGHPSLERPPALALVWDGLELHRVRVDRLAAGLLPLG